MEMIEFIEELENNFDIEIPSDALKGFTEAETNQLHNMLYRVYENMANTKKKEGLN